MASDDLINEMQRLHRLDEQLRRQKQKQRHGDFTTATADAVRAQNELEVPRQDLTGIEVVEIILLSLRRRFANDVNFPWVGQAQTDVQASSIVIESVFSARGMAQDFNKPHLEVRPGPAADQDLAVGDLKHFDMGSGAHTMTSLETGTIQVACKSVHEAQALVLASLVVLHLRSSQRDLWAKGIHAIRNLTRGGYEGKNVLYNQTVNGVTHAVVPVTFTYFWQWGMRVTPREGVYEPLRLFQQSIGVREGSDPESYERFQSRSPLNERLTFIDSEFSDTDVVDPEEEP